MVGIFMLKNRIGDGRMKRKIFKLVFIITITVVLCLFGCSSSAETVESASGNDDILEEVGSSAVWNGDITEYRDADTGVHYFGKFEQTHAYNAAGGLCPRYNADGSLYVD